jgi:hypothetical protein
MISTALKILFIFFKDKISAPMKIAEIINGIPIPKENTKRSDIPSITLSELAAIDNIPAKIGPMQGVHPKAKRKPATKGKIKSGNF